MTPTTGRGRFCAIILAIVGLICIGITVALAVEAAAVLIGATAYLGWWYASGKAALLSENVSDEEARDVAQANFAEPITALLTIPAAFIGPGAWELSWFLYPFLKWLLGRRRAGA
jgi:hypothetical protein